jgi:outer membrane receptor protein involved in Fe transport
MADALFLRTSGITIADYFDSVAAPGTPPLPRNPDGSSFLPMGDSYFNRLLSHDRQIAGFGEVNFNITDALKLTAGVRVSRTKFSIQSLSDGPQNGGPRPGSHEQSETPVTPKFGLSYQADPNNLYYATYAKGFRIGGGNPSVPATLCATDFQTFGITQAPDTYQSDAVRSYEIGAKNNINNRIRLASSVYYIKWDNIQQNVVPPICQIQWTQNLGEAVSKGFDLQADFAVGNALTVDTAIGYTDARYTKDSFPGAASAGILPVVANGDAIAGQNGVGSGVGIPPWTAAIGAEYKFSAFAHESFVRVDYQYQAGDKWLHAARDPRTSSYDNKVHTDPSFTLPIGSTRFASLRAGTNIADWAVSLFVDNLTDTHTITNFNHQSNSYDPTMGALLATPLYRNISYRPRTFGITAVYRY